jgi:ASCH domain
MLALTIREPYASLVASGRKTIEMRTWDPSHRGELMICSGARGKGKPGVTVARVELVAIRYFVESDCEAACYDDWHPDDDFFAWELRLIKRVKPTPVVGKLRLFDLRTAIEDAKLRAADSEIRR